MVLNLAILSKGLVSVCQFAVFLKKFSLTPWQEKELQLIFHVENSSKSLWAGLA